MGMFDYVRCEVPLPDGWSADELQTKDFDMPYLETYTIRADGRLIHRRPRYDIDPPDAPHGEIDTNFHGVLNFYGLETTGYEPPQPGDHFRRPITIWHEYNAKFTDGKLVGIEHVPDRDAAGQ